MPGSKKAKRDAARAGGVVAAVTEHVAKLNGNAKGFASDTSSSSVQSPEIRPVGTPSSNGNPTVSPVLDAVPTTSYLPSAAAPTSAWPRAIPQLAGSPGNLISFVGESPPTQPSSYEDPRAINSAWSSPRPYVNSPPPASATPPNPARRPLSFQMDTHYQPSEAPSRAAIPAARRSSMHSHAALSRTGANPPLPHQPQAHFYGLPDIDFDLQPQTGMKAGERGYHFSFDTLPTPNTSSGPGTDAVVTAGYEGGLEVYSVSRRGLEPLASLKGLRGGVRRAKILSWTSAGPGSELFPLVAVVVHGPAFPSAIPDIGIQGDYDGVTSDPSSGSPAPQGEPTSRDSMGVRGGLPVEFYQTSVEVYSLKNSKRVGILLEAPKIQLQMPITSPIFKAPQPTGAFHIEADDGNIVVSSGVTGEFWIFRQIIQTQEPVIQFRCLSKLWTTLQQPPKSDTTQEAERARMGPLRQTLRSPIVALRGRWIAYCPATPSSQMALRASVAVPAQGKAPGLSTLTPPQLPPVNSDVDLPLNESMMNRIMRDATQEIISGAKWVGQQGWQAINNYWKGGPSTAQPPRSPPLGSQPWGIPYPSRQDMPQFPPTHGAAAPAISKEPGIVSIVDIETLGNSSTVHPIATFPAPTGCSFLSFSPAGLLLLTVSTKGDVQTVWDLLRMQYTKSSPLQSLATPGTPNGPRVRQVALFSRMTVARIVYVAWTKPHGEGFAMVTERGTVHLFNMPSSASTWPPPRRRTRQQEVTTAADGPGSAVAYASSALTSAIDAARPLLARPRRSSTNIPQSTGASIVDHASLGGKMIAAGISHSLGKTSNAISQLRHNGDNRVALPSSAAYPGPRCVAWVTRKRQHSLYLLGDGMIRAYPTRGRKSAPGTESQRAPRLNRFKDFRVPTLPADTIASAVKRSLEPEEYLDLMDDADAGNNTMILDSRAKVPVQDPASESSIPQAEIESSAPYQPFHTDRRVALFEYEAQATTALQLPAISALQLDSGVEPRPSSPLGPRKKGQKKPDATAVESRNDLWAFGQPISCVQLDTGYGSMSEESSVNLSTDDVRALPPSAMERVLQHVGDNDTQIVVTTRRRRGGGRSAEQEDDGFFEDDCEVLDFADQRV